MATDETTEDIQVTLKFIGEDGIQLSLTGEIEEVLGLLTDEALDSLTGSLATATTVTASGKSLEEVLGEITEDTERI